MASQRELHLADKHELGGRTVGDAKPREILNQYAASFRSIDAAEIEHERLVDTETRRERFGVSIGRRLHAGADDRTVDTGTREARAHEIVFFGRTKNDALRAFEKL